MRTPHFKSAGVLHSFAHAFCGIQVAFREERNFRIQCGYAVLVSALLMWYRPSPEATAIVGLSLVALLSAELVNSALEKTIDLACPRFDERAGEAKDVSAAAVMLMAFASAAISLWVLAPMMKLELTLLVMGLFLWMFSNRQVAQR